MTEDLELTTEVFAEVLEAAIYRGVKRAMTELRGTKELDEQLWELTVAQAVDVVGASDVPADLRAWLEAEEYRTGGRRDGVLEAIDFRIRELTED